MNGTAWGMMGVGWLLGLVFLVLLALLVGLGVWLVIRLGSGGTSRRSRGLEILDERLARGELSIDEYRERRAVLEERR